jgi:hypothetical protein
MTTSNEHNNAPAVPQGWKLVPLEPTPEIIEAICHAKNLTRNGLRAVMSDTELASIYRAMLAATPAPAPAQDEPFGYFKPEPFGWTDCAADDEGAIALYERPQEVGLTASQFDMICQAIDKADTATMEGDYFSLDTSDWPNCHSYTFRFTWCCFALRWAIAHYDIAKAFQKDAA